MGHPVVLFDGACGFCTWCVLAERRYVRSGLEFVPYQRADLSALGVSATQAAESVLFVTGEQVLDGARAVAAVLRSGRAPWPRSAPCSMLPRCDRSLRAATGSWRGTGAGCPGRHRRSSRSA